MIASYLFREFGSILFKMRIMINPQCVIKHGVLLLEQIWCVCVCVSVCVCARACACVRVSVMCCAAVNLFTSLSASVTPGLGDTHPGG